MNRLRIVRLLKKIYNLLFTDLIQKESIPGTIITGDINNVTIGERVSFGGRVILYATAPITIGSDTMIGMDVMFHASTHDYMQHPMWKNRTDRPIQVGEHVWIGTRALIFPGVKIGNYAVVGAGSVVTAHVPVGAIVAGNPARIIRYRNINDKQINTYDTENYPNNSMICTKGFLSEKKVCKKK